MIHHFACLGFHVNGLDCFLFWQVGINLHSLEHWHIHICRLERSLHSYKINLAITNWDILCNEIEFQPQGLSSYIGYALRIFHTVHVTNLDIFSYIFLWGHTSCNLLGCVLLHIPTKGKLDRTHWKNWTKRCAYQIKNVNNKVCIREIHSFTTFHVVLIKNINNFIPLTIYN